MSAATIDITPTWAGVLPILIAAIERGNATGRGAAVAELKRMAEAADRLNHIADRYATLDARVELCGRYSKALDDAELPPNGDDFNALLDFLSGVAYHAPSRQGR